MGEAADRSAFQFCFLMASEEDSPSRAETAQTTSRCHVVVTGAGFTRALVPDAPLLVDDYNNDTLEERVRGLPNASRLLDWGTEPASEGSHRH